MEKVCHRENCGWFKELNSIVPQSSTARTTDAWLMVWIGVKTEMEIGRNGRETVGPGKL